MASNHSPRTLVSAGIGLAMLASSAPAYAQLDPLLFLKRSAPNVLVMVDAGNRMQRDAPTDPANPQATSNYYDLNIYTRGENVTAEGTLGVTAGNTMARYRRKYVHYTLTSLTNPDRGITETIQVTRDLPNATAIEAFDAPTRMALGRAALYRAIQAYPQSVARFGLYKMRQSGPTPAFPRSGGTIVNTDPSQNQIGTTEASNGKWYIARPDLGGRNGALLLNQGNPAMVRADAVASNVSVLAKLALPVNTAGALIPAGLDDANTTDEPVQSMLEDLKAEAVRLMNADTLCRNTVAILITGGGEGTTTIGANPAAFASQFLSAVADRRVPIIVIAIAPPSADVGQLQAIARNSGGQYFEITKAQIDVALASPAQAVPSGDPMAGTVVVPELVRAINIGVQTAFQEYADINTAAAWSGPWKGFEGYAGSPSIPSSEFLVTSPIIGTVNLEGGKDIDGGDLPYTSITGTSDAKIPQRSNVMVTSAFALPGFDGVMRAFRVYRPDPDSTQLSGYKFLADGTALWVASTPSEDLRNLYTASPDGTMIPFTTANAATLAPYMNLSVADATEVIRAVRKQPIGPILDSTPAIMNPPSLDPPPDATYPGFLDANKDRRTIIFVGTNNGILEGIDARLGKEVWGFIPFNLLPKLKTTREGQSVGGFTYMMDGSPKVADVRLADGWHTYMFIGEGPGGTFYQTFDVTMAAMHVAPESDDLSSVLGYFSSATVIPLRWTYPLYSNFDPAMSTATMPYGDLKTSATATEKTVGQTWSDPAVGQIETSTSPYVMLTGSGFLPYSTQHQANRGDAIAGTTFYMFDAGTGTLLDSKNVGSDGVAETVDDCRAATANPNYCNKFKNALQSDPVATGPSDSRFITKAYLGDLDGKVWRFDIGVDSSSVPAFRSGSNPTKLYDDPLKQPIFGSMATINIGGTQQYVFTGTGGDILPSNGVSTQYRLLGILDNGGSGTKTFEYDLMKVDNIAGDEKVTTFPAVAGDIVFFTTTTINPAAPCTPPTAALYALTFIGGPAYDTDNNGRYESRKDSVQVKTVAGQRATAPFIVDQHLVFGAGRNIQMFGDPDAFNNGIGQAGVRILSWREVR